MGAVRTIRERLSMFAAVQNRPIGGNPGIGRRRGGDGETDIAQR
jgi:hypothetical protein